MKRKKIITYILLMIVLGVWGYVFRNIYMNLIGGEDKASVKQQQAEASRSALKISSDFELLLDYDDPFGVEYRPRSVRKVRSNAPTRRTTQKKHAPAKKDKTAPEKDNHVPKITYHGMIKENEGDEALAVITVDEQREMVGLGQRPSGLLIEGIYPDSIVVDFGNGKRVVVGK